RPQPWRGRGLVRPAEKTARGGALRAAIDPRRLRCDETLPEEGTPSRMTRERIEVLGLGNSLVDILAPAEDDFLRAEAIQKGGMTLSDEARAEALYAHMSATTIVSGGSAANTVVGVRSLGVNAAYIGKVKDDELGRAFIHDIRATGVGFSVKPAADGPATGRCYIFVTPDGERSMNTYL